MKAVLATTQINPHSRRLLVDEAEWRERLNHLAEMRRTFSATPVAADDTVLTPKDERASATRSS